jgi:hypothetical protein
MLPVRNSLPSAILLKKKAIVDRFKRDLPNAASSIILDNQLSWDNSFFITRGKSDHYNQRV